ncbi:MAG: MBL fold metallo-hydrolase [Candidatus Krumholzibacteriota bacterium]|nr:MBL fold metallo-hydrolase [Candidatus Krumholzibacteriota bacterium]
MSIKLKFLGGVREVTGSNHLITTGNSKIIIDCGLFQGHRGEYFEKNSRFSFSPDSLNAMILSHAHIDHSGNIPNLVKQGFASRILTTDATRDLCSAMLPDSGHIQEEDIKYVNKIHRKKGLPPVTPLYTRKDAEKSLQYFSGHPYRQKVMATEDVSVTFYDAGHVLGSSTPLLEIGNGEKDDIKIAYAVDLGRKNIPILNDPETPPAIDYLILESTYGGRLHDPVDKAKDRLAEIITGTAKRGGKIIIPSFALERTQEIAYYLNQLLLEDRIPGIPIYVDSPLAVNITEIFIKHPECYDQEMYDAFRSGMDPLGTNRIKYITDVEESKALNQDDQPMIIISASGMCEAGRIVHHLKNNIGDPRNTVLVIGYMAQNTLGRRIVEKHEQVRIFGEDQALRAQVVVMNTFSAHADRNDLFDYVKPLKNKLKKIFIVHGEEDQSEKLYRLLTDNGFPAFFPQLEEEIELS